MIRAIVVAAGALSLSGCAIFDFDFGGDPVSPPPPPAAVTDFTYYGPGQLVEGSGEGVADYTIWAPDIVFPIKGHKTLINSQVYGDGGMFGGGGGQCSEANYSYPWRDNFCETRSGRDRATLNCPRRDVHQGQDLRAGDSALCQEIRSTPQAQRRQVPVVAVGDGEISYIGSYTVNLTRPNGDIYRYMHLNMQALEVGLKDKVQAGDVLGYLSDDFGGNPTTLHLHLEFKHPVQGVGVTWVNSYMSLVRAYERQLGGVGQELNDGPVAALSTR